MFVFFPFLFLVLCKYAPLHTGISCYTSTVTGMFHIALCNTPYGVKINEDTCDQLYFQFSVSFVSARQVPVMWLHISWVRFVSLETIVGRDIFK